MISRPAASRPAATSTWPRCGRRGHELALTLIDDDNAGHPGGGGPAAADPERPWSWATCAPCRCVPRSADIVHCCLLLDRISHAELVLGRLVDALRPGGLLLLRTADRDSAAGFLDRLLPGPLRARPGAACGPVSPARTRPSTSS